MLLYAPATSITGSWPSLSLLDPQPAIMVHMAMAGNQLDLKFLIVLFKVFMVRCLYSKCDLFIIIYDYAGPQLFIALYLPEVLHLLFLKEVIYTSEVFNDPLVGEFIDL